MFYLRLHGQGRDGDFIGFLKHFAKKKQVMLLSGLFFGMRLLLWPVLCAPVHARLFCLRTTACATGFVFSGDRHPPSTTTSTTTTQVMRFNTDHGHKCNIHAPDGQITRDSLGTHTACCPTFTGARAYRYTDTLTPTGTLTH